MLLIDGIWSKDIIDMRCVNMLNLAGQLKAGQGLAVAVAFIKGNSDKIEDRRRADDVSQCFVSPGTIRKKRTRSFLADQETNAGRYG